jgi:hypothetical protein
MAAKGLDAIAAARTQLASEECGLLRAIAHSIKKGWGILWRKASIFRELIYSVTKVWKLPVYPLIIKLVSGRYRGALHSWSKNEILYISIGWSYRAGTRERRAPGRKRGDNTTMTWFHGAGQCRP